METNKDFGTPGAASGIGGRTPQDDRSRRLERLGDEAERLTEEAATAAQDLKDRASRKLDDAREALSDRYDRTRDTLNRTYDRALDYSRENPGTALLIGFGAGIGVGLLLAGSTVRRRSGVLPVVANALTDIAYEVLERR
jgi:ElaB/YqjD/DUF883 family membrane-anchored ribosome-binding protein